MMLTDYCIEPLKGTVFKMSRDTIIGYKPILSLESIPVSIKERAGNNGKFLKLFLIENVVWHV